MGLSDQIRHYLDSITLQDVLLRKNVRMVAERQDQLSSGGDIEIPLQRGIRA
jgi:Rrf2 family iron-sulfur cluster assembly transcriptional regulator